MFTAASGAGDREMTATQTIKVTVTDVTSRPARRWRWRFRARRRVASRCAGRRRRTRGRRLRTTTCGIARGASGAWTDAGHEGTGLSLTLTGLDAATAYRVQVRAVNAEGMGVWSEAAGETTRAPEARLPGKATGLTAEPGDRRVRLEWDSLGDASVTKWQYRVRSPGRANYHAWRDVPGSGAETTSYTSDGERSVQRRDLSFPGACGERGADRQGCPCGSGTGVGRRACDGGGGAGSGRGDGVGTRSDGAGGCTASYTVALESRPSVSVTIAVAKQPGGDDDLRAAPASLEFTPSNWDAAQTVTVSAAGDEDVEDGRAVFAHTATSGDSAYRAIEIASVTAVEQDTTSETVPSSGAGVTVYPKSLTIKDDARYEVVLDSKPSANVTVVVRNPRIEVINLLTPSHDISEDNGQRYSLTFTPSNWSHPQPVWMSVRNGDDGDTEDNTFALSHAAQSPDEEYDGIAIDDVLIREQEWSGPRAAVQHMYVRDGHGAVGKVLGFGSSFGVHGGDSSQFSVTPEGILMFRSPPDFDAPTDKA